MADEVENIKKTTDEALKNIKPEEEQIDEMKGVGQLGKPIIASTSCKTYYLRPVSFEKTPELVNLVKGISEDLDGKDDSSYMEIFSNPDSKLFKSMTEIILMGFEMSHPELTAEIIMKEFSLKDFPIVYRETLGLNDFLAGMRMMVQ